MDSTYLKPSGRYTTFSPQQLHSLLALGRFHKLPAEIPPPFLLIAVLLTQAVLESQIKGCHLQRAPLPRSSHIAQVSSPICIAFCSVNAQLSGLSSASSLSSVLTLGMLHRFATASLPLAISLCPSFFPSRLLCEQDLLRVVPSQLEFYTAAISGPVLSPALCQEPEYQVQLPQLSTLKSHLICW